MKINRLHLALLLAIACMVGLFFGYKMGVKMRNGDNRVLYPVAPAEMVDSTEVE